MTRSPAPVANHGGWYAGLTVRVVLCSVSACLREFGRVGESRHPLLGGVSIEATVVSEDRPVVMALRISLGRAGPNWDLLGYEGGGKLLVVFVFIIFTAGRKCAQRTVRCWDVTGRFSGTGCAHAPFLLLSFRPGSG
jgi:hypothetical protein